MNRRPGRPPEPVARAAGVAAFLARCATRGPTLRSIPQLNPSQAGRRISAAPGKGVAEVDNRYLEIMESLAYRGHALSLIHKIW